MWLKNVNNLIDVKKDITITTLNPFKGSKTKLSNKIGIGNSGWRSTEARL